MGTGQITEASASTDPQDRITELLTGQTPTEEVVEQTSEDTTDDEAEFEEPDQSDYEDSDESEPSEESEYDLADVADVLGLGADDLTVDDNGNLMFITKVDGKVGKVTLADLRKGYQMESANTQRSQQLAEEKKAFEAEREQRFARMDQQIQQTEGLVMLMHQKLMSDFNGVNWEELRQLDPAEYTAKRYDFEQRQQELNQAASYGQYVRQQRQAELDQDESKFFEANWQTMIENNPTWQDNAVYEKDMAELREFGKHQYGFTDDDFASVRHAGIIELIKDAMAFRKGKKVVEQKKVKRQAPKLQRAKNGRFVANKGSRFDKLVKAAKGAKGANKREIQNAAVTELLMKGN